MSDAILALREAVQALLAANAALTTLIGPDRIFDEAPDVAVRVVESSVVEGRHGVT